MFLNFLSIILFFLSTNPAFAKRSDNGKIIDRQVLKLNESEDQLKALNNKVLIEKITYLSDGLKIKGYLMTPKSKGKYPCIIWNRGGNRDFGKITKKLLGLIAKMASWGYIVIASQYRGGGGSEGKDEFGGADINDVMNLIPLLENLKNSDTSSMGVFGWSRGSMMTLLALTRTNKFKAAVIGGIVSDQKLKFKHRKTFEKNVFSQLIPNYYKNKEKELNKRSAIKFVSKINKKTPILMMHGTSDWRTIPENALKLSKEFIKHKIPYRLVMFEGGNHCISEFRKEWLNMTKRWFNDFLKNDRPLPNLNPHGK